MLFKSSEAHELTIPLQLMRIKRRSVPKKRTRATAARSVGKKSDAIPLKHNQKTNIDKSENFSLTTVMNSPIDRSSIFCLPSFVYRAIGTAL